MLLLREFGSPLGTLTAACDGNAITGLWLPGQKYYLAGAEDAVPGDAPVFWALERYLVAYFAGEAPKMDLPLAPQGSAYRQQVWRALLEIPYGQAVTYGQLAERVGGSPRSVGGAVGRNPISILIPCHRVVGSGGSLTGYAGGLDAKRFLLRLEAGGGTWAEI